MKKATRIRLLMVFSLLAGGGVLLIARLGHAHCDTLDGPVVAAARRAFELQEVTPVLRWVRPDDETEIRHAFEEALAVRRQGGPARDLADKYFFETLVRVHRAGEGVPYTGLKPSGTEVDPGIAMAEASLTDEATDKLTEDLAHRLADNLAARLAAARQAQAHAEESVEAGRAAVAAYVDYIHYVAGVHQAIEGNSAGHTEEEAFVSAASEAHAHTHMD